MYIERNGAVKSGVDLTALWWNIQDAGQEKKILIGESLACGDAA